MSWLDFFRKTKKETEVSVAKEISINELKHFIAKEQETIKGQKESIKQAIGKNLLILVSELKVNLGILRTLNIDRIKEQEKLKLIVKENLYFYVSYLEKLIAALEKIPKFLETEEYISQIQTIFNNFKKSSDKSFEKATILIGRELESVQKNIREFFQKNSLVISENKSLFDRSVVIAKLQENLGELEKTKEIISKVKTNISDLEKQTQNLETKKKEQSSLYAMFINSQEYKKALEEKQGTEKEIEAIDGELRNIKEKIDLRFLLKHFYSDAKRRALLSSYRENFLAAIEMDKELEIASLVKEVFHVRNALVHKDGISEHPKNSQTQQSFFGYDLKAQLSEIMARKAIIDKKNKETSAETKENAIKESIKEKEFDILQCNKQIEEENKKISRFNERALLLLAEIENKAKEAFGNVRVVE